jgi:hypothetical protein
MAAQVVQLEQASQLMQCVEGLLAAVVKMESGQRQKTAMVEELVAAVLLGLAIVAVTEQKAPMLL